MKRKLLKLLFLVVVSSILVLIIYATKETKINLVILGDYLGIKDDINSSYYPYLKKELKIRRYNNYSKKAENMETLYTRITTTSEIKRSLREAELVTLSIGINDFYNSIRDDITTSNLLDLKDDISTLLPRLEDLLKEIRKYAKYDVVLIGYYNPVPFLFNTNSSEIDLLFLYINSMVKDICSKYDITYIPLYSLFKDNNYLGEDIYPNNNGYKAISDEILKNSKNVSHFLELML